jgi:hypothetical protein
MKTCNKIKLRIECKKCGYPFCEARYPDKDNKFNCDTKLITLLNYIKSLQQNLV